MTDSDPTDDVLPFETDETDVREGIGIVVQIVDLSEYRGEGRNPKASRQSVTPDGRCFRCGYDRGERSEHTEVEGYQVECRHCGERLVEAGPR